MEAIVLGSTVLLSSLVWTWIALRKMRSKPIVPPAGLTEVVPIVASAIAVCWVAIQLISVMQGGEPTVYTIQKIKNGTIQSGVIAFVLAVIYSVGNQTKQENQLPAMRAISLGLLAMLASMMPVLMVQFGIQQVLETKGPSHGLLQFIQKTKSPEAVFWVGAAAVVAAPLLEELLYRVILQGTLKNRMPTSAAILVSSLLFSVVHGWPAMLGLFPLAVILGYLYDRTNSYLAVVTAHAAFNMFMLLASTLPTATSFAIIM